MTSTVAENDPVDVPPVLLKTTVAPPADKLFPAASRACKVAMTELPETTLADDTEINEFDPDIAPGVTVTVGSVVETEDPPIVPVIVVAVPARTPVNVEVYVPSLLLMTAEKLPVDVPPDLANATVAPPEVKLFPAASRLVRVTVIPAPETTDADETEITDVAELASPGDTVTVGIADKTVLPPIVALSVVGVPAKTPVKTAE